MTSRTGKTKQKKLGAVPDAAAASAPPVSVSGGTNAAVAVAVISSFLFGYSITVLDTCGQLIPVVFEWCNSDWQSDCLASRVCQSLINASIYLGAACGALLIGRSWMVAGGARRQIIISDAFFVVGGLACALAQGVALLLLGRLISGVGLGLSGIAAPVYIAEISPRERRGANSAMHGVFITLGIFASIVFGLPQSPPPRGPGEALEGLDFWFWRILLGLPVLPALVQGCFFRCVVPLDSPSLLVQQGKVREARRVLYQSYNMVPLEPGAMDCEISDSHRRLESMIQDLVSSCEVAKEIPRIYVCQALFDPFLRCPLFVGFGLSAFQQLCGINALMSYSNSLFQEAGVAPANLTLASTIMAGVNVAVSLLSSRVVDRWGRRTLLLGSGFFQALSMAIISCKSAYPVGSTGVVAIVSFCLFVVSFTGGLGAVTWLYLAEVYPMEIRGPALSACGVINWVCCFLIVFSTRFLTLHSACSLFGAISAVGYVFVKIWVIETKGCSMEDSPLTPRSARSSSTLLTPVMTPTGQLLDYNSQQNASDVKLHGMDDGTE